MIRISAFFIINIICSIAVLSQSVPDNVLKVDRNLWPYKIHSPGEFDFASKMNMLVFIRVFNSRISNLQEDSLKTHLNLKKISLPSVILWQKQVKDILVSSFENLPAAIPHDYVRIEKPVTWTGLTKAAASLESGLDPRLQIWYSQALRFHEKYCYDQLYLAAIFGEMPNEIICFNPAETNGSDFRDRNFLVTLNCEPISGVNTVSQIGSQYNIQTLNFFPGDFSAKNSEPVLIAHGGNKVTGLTVPSGNTKRVKNSGQKAFNMLYAADSAGQVKKLVRPEFARRDAKIAEQLRNEKIRTVLWNIDSGDWKEGFTSSDVADRVITLMLFWRKGIMLFHEKTGKVKEAVPVISEYFKDSKIQWMSPDNI